jgi:hypothetical protein
MAGNGPAGRHAAAGGRDLWGAGGRCATAGGRDARGAAAAPLTDTALAAPAATTIPAALVAPVATDVAGTLAASAAAAAPIALGPSADATPVALATTLPSTAPITLAAVVPPTVSISTAAALAAAVALAATVAVPAAATIPVAITLDVAVSASVALAASVPVTSVFSVPMAALIGEGWPDQMMEGIDRGERGAATPKATSRRTVAVNRMRGGAGGRRWRKSREASCTNFNWVSGLKNITGQTDHTACTAAAQSSSPVRAAGQVARTIAAVHSMGPHGPEESPSALPPWRCRSEAGG